MVFVEASFPRGGQPVKQNLIKNEVFGVAPAYKGSKSQKKKASINDNSEDKDVVKSNSAQTLTYKTVSEGMIVMGCVENVNRTQIKISIPGRLYGTISAVSISDSYTELLKLLINDNENAVEGYKSLDELFSCGDNVYAKLKSRNSEGKFEFSLIPSDVHELIRHNNIKKNMFFSFAIKSIEDHGYIMETGIKKLNAFLPNDKNNSGLGIGELVPCKVLAISTKDQSTTIQLKSFTHNELRKIKNINDINLDYLLPCSIVDFTVTKILKNGLQGTIFDNFIAYVNEHNLNDATDTPNDYEIGKVYTAKLLYVMPMTKLTYLSLNTTISNNVLPNGTVIEDAKVMHIGTGGIILKLDDENKGLITFKMIKSSINTNYDSNEVMEKYAKNSNHSVRILSYEQIDNIYMCSDNPKILKEKYFSINELNIGDIVKCVVIKHTNECLVVKFGKIQGIISNHDLCPKTPLYKKDMIIKAKIVSLNAEELKVLLTNRKEYMRNKAELLTNTSQIVVKNTFLGMVVKELQNLYLIRFFNVTTGFLYKNLNKENEIKVPLEIGKVMKFEIVKINDKNVPFLKIATILNDDGGDEEKIKKSTIINVTKEHIEVFFNNNIPDGKIPLDYLCENKNLSKCLAKSLKLGKYLDVVSLANGFYSHRDTDYYLKNDIIDYKDVNIGTILRCIIVEKNENTVEVLLPVKMKRNIIKIHKSMLFDTKILITKHWNEMSVNQIIYLRVLCKEGINETLTLSGRFSNLWDGELTTTINMFNKYFSEINEIKINLMAKKDNLGDLNIGDVVTGKVIDNDDDNNINVELDNGLHGTINKNNVLYKINDKINCIILSINYENKEILLSSEKNLIKCINKMKNNSDNIVIGKKYSGEILYKNNDYILLSSLKDNIPLIYIPVKLNYNDFMSLMLLENNLSNLDEIDFVIINKNDDDGKLIGMFYKTYKNVQNIIKFKDNLKLKMSKIEKRKLPLEKENDKIDSKKRKIEDKITIPMDTNGDKNDSSEVDEENEVEMRTGDQEDIENKVEERIEEKLVLSKEKPKKLNEKNEKVKAILPGAESFWTTDINTIITENKSEKQEESSSEEDEHDKVEVKKKKKLTASERFQLGKEEEAKLRCIEENLMNSTMEPESIDQFERLILSKPNSSIAWIKYMAFNLQATEIDKARSVARRALKTITYREEEELINIWVALLNLELRYGNKDSFNDVLQEALQTTDGYKIHVRCIKILIDANRVQELNDILSTIIKKYKEKTDMWSVVAAAYFEVGMAEKAKQLLHRALASLRESDHVNMIIKFANLNNKYGQKETGHALYEQILASYPKRVDIWSQYIDLLIKDGQIDSARQTLERAAAQKLPIKKMKTIFKKYLEFETSYGDTEKVDKVKQIAADYVNTEIDG